MVCRSISGLLWQNDKKKRKQWFKLNTAMNWPPQRDSLWWHDDTFNTHLSYKDAHFRLFPEHIALSISTSLLLCIPHEIFTLKRDAYSSGAMSRQQECCGKEGLHWWDAMIFGRTALCIVWYCFYTLLQTLYFTATFKVLALVTSHGHLSPSNQTPV